MGPKLLVVVTSVTFLSVACEPGKLGMRKMQSTLKSDDLTADQKNQQKFRCDEGKVTDQQIKALLTSKCISCHGSAVKSGGIDFSEVTSSSSLSDNLDLIARSQAAIEKNIMPPGGGLNDCEKSAIARWSEGNGTQLLDTAGRICHQEASTIESRTLTTMELKNSFSSQFGIDNLSEQNFLRDFKNGHGFARDGASMVFVLNDADKLLALAEEVAGNLSTRHSCNKSNLNCIKTFASQYLGMLFRRDAQPADIDSFVEIVQSETDINTGMKKAFTVKLMSPRSFMVLTKLKDDSAAFSLAERLSFFLWSKPPDAELLAKARDGSLFKSEVLKSETLRMIQNENFRDNFPNVFTSKWLEYENLETVERANHAGFSSALLGDMKTETKLFVEHIVNNNLPLQTFIDANYSFLNDRLREHYGVARTGSQEFTRTNLPPERQGILTHGSLMTVTGDSGDTSPIHRGNWLLNKVMCRNLGSPPPGALENAPVTEPNATKREKVAVHRQNAVCAGCHDTIDPLGFGFENFNSIGGFRSAYENHAIDATGELYGREFQGATGLIDIINESGDFDYCIAEKLSSFAFTKSSKLNYQCFVSEMASAAKTKNLGVKDLIVEIVLSEDFRAP